MTTKTKTAGATKNSKNSVAANCITAGQALGATLATALIGSMFIIAAALTCGDGSKIPVELAFLKPYHLSAQSHFAPPVRAQGYGRVVVATR